MNAITETYHDVKLWIRQTVQDYRRAAGGDIEELQAEAAVHYCKAFHNYDRARAAFTTHVRFVVMKGLQETGRNHIKKDANRRKYKNLALEPARHRADVLAWASTLSPDARCLIQLALEPVNDISMEAGMRRGGRNNPNALRSALYEYMRGAQWSAKRIATAFKEIADNLQGEME